jgi:hypothetical protein
MGDEGQSMRDECRDRDHGHVWKSHKARDTWRADRDVEMRCDCGQRSCNGTILVNPKHAFPAQWDEMWAKHEKLREKGETGADDH